MDLESGGGGGGLEVLISSYLGGCHWNRERQREEITPTCFCQLGQLAKRSDYSSYEQLDNSLPLSCLCCLAFFLGPGSGSQRTEMYDDLYPS